jgi:proteasome accessory factor B
MPPGSKTQRWIDLLAALLARRYPVTFDALVPDVPAYATSNASRASLLRMFERDKDELRALGVPIETVPDANGDLTAYRIAPTDFYLPYLCIVGAQPSRATRPRRVDRFGYHALRELSFTADELAVVADAAARIRALGEPLLAEDAESAMRKLAVDLPMDATTTSQEVLLVDPADKPDARNFDTLSDALTRRKTVEVEYRSLSRDETERRSLEPYGLFFLGTHWYLAARDRSNGELRNYRLSRIGSATVNAARAQTPDYDIPADFRLREHAKSRQAWELGDGDTVQATVRFRDPGGAAAAARRLGEPVPGHSDWRTFSVRRADAFVRWLLSFGGEAVPIAPPSIVAAYAEHIADTRAVYDRDAAAAPSPRRGGDR